MEHTDEEELSSICECGCTCCSSVSSAVYIKIHTKDKETRLMVAVGVQTDSSGSLPPSSTTDGPLGIGTPEDLRTRESQQTRKKSKLDAKEREKAEVEQSGVHDHETRKRKLQTAFPEATSESIGERRSKRTSVKYTELPQPKGEKSQAVKFTSPTRLSAMQKSGTALSASQIQIRANTSPSSGLNLALSTSLNSPTLQAGDESMALSAINDSQPVALQSSLSGPRKSSSKLDVAASSSSEVVANKAEAGENRPTVGFMLDADCAPGKALINTMLNRARVRALTYVMQPPSSGTELDAQKPARRAVTIRSNFCEVLQDEARLFTDCEWLFVCMDEESCTFPYFATLTEKIEARRASNPEARMPNLVLVRSKMVRDAARGEQLRAFIDACTGAACSVIELALVYSWQCNLSNAKGDDEHTKSDAESGKDSNNKLKRKPLKSTRHAKAIAACCSLSLYCTFQAMFGNLFQDCVQIEAELGDILAFYFTRMEAGVLSGVSHLTTLPRALKSTFDTDTSSHRIVDACVSSVVRGAMVFLVELDTPAERRLIEPSKHVARLASKPVASPSVARMRKIAVIDFSGKVLSLVDARCPRSGKHEHNYNVSKLVFDYRWRSQHRLVVGAVDAHQLTVRLGSVLLSKSSYDNGVAEQANGHDLSTLANVSGEEQTGTSRSSKKESLIEPNSMLFFDLYKGERPFTLGGSSGNSRKRKSDPKLSEDASVLEARGIALADSTPFMSDFAGEYEAPADSEFAHLNGAKWGFSAIGNTLFEILLHGNSADSEPNFAVYDIHDVNEAVIRGVRFIAARNVLLTYTHLPKNDSHAMHFLHLNPVTKLFEPHAVMFERKCCSPYTDGSLNRAELCVFDETRARMHMFAIVDDAANRTNCTTKNKNDGNSEVESRVQVHGDRFYVSDDCQIVFEGCFPEFGINTPSGEDEAVELQRAVHSISGSQSAEPNDVDEADAQKTPSKQSSFSMIAFSQKFKNFVWCIDGSFYTTTCE